MPRIFAALSALILGFASAASAQDDTELSIELNRATSASEAQCQVVFVGRNALDQAFDEITLRLAVFDASGVFQNMLALPLGQLDSQNRRIVQFNLPTGCADISEIVVNDVLSCKESGAADSSGICQDQLVVSSRTSIAFGL